MKISVFSSSDKVKDTGNTPLVCNRRKCYVAVKISENKDAFIFFLSKFMDSLDLEFMDLWLICELCARLP